MTHRLLPWLALAGALVVLTPGLVHAQGGPEPSASRKQSARALIAKGQDHFDEQRYEESVQVLSAALMRPGTDKPERIQIYKLLAYNYIVLRRDEEADGAVRGLLVIEPEFRLPETESPRFRDFFAKIRQDWEAEG